MAFLVILKRFEVWVLIAVFVGLFVFALRPEPAPDDVKPSGDALPDKRTLPDGPDAEPVPDVKPVISLQEVRVAESGGGFVVETILSGRSPSDTDLVLDETGVTATSAEGLPVNRFFEPFAQPVVLSASEDTLATIRWWLVERTEGLSLDVQGHHVAVDLP